MSAPHYEPESERVSYKVPLPPDASTLVEGLSMAVRKYGSEPPGWMVLVGTIPHPAPVHREEGKG